MGVHFVNIIIHTWVYVYVYIHLVQCVGMCACTCVCVFLLMQCNGRYISWGHLTKLYNHDTSTGEGIRTVPKLKFEHISLTSLSKMRVDLAAQVRNEYKMC